MGNNIIRRLSHAIFVALLAGILSLACQDANQEERTREGDSDRYVEGVGEQQEVMPTLRHLPEDERARYNTVPPTSGDHWARWSDCGFFVEGLPDERIVHNLEHGIIIISYNLPDETDVDALKDAVDKIDLYGEWGLTRFYHRIPEGTVAVAAWGVLDRMDGVDGKRIENFFNAYAGRLGPEQIPCEARRVPMDSA